ncbi:hypothetical protein NMY22_g4355 [Coprinellus aureogranulatus]|nr:hypothetical protein NMY22_g4355 [Coprinellus aureogranulatus]
MSSSDCLVDDVLLDAFQYLAEKSRQSFANVFRENFSVRRFPFLTKLSTTGYPSILIYDAEFTTEILSRCGTLSLDVGWDVVAQTQTRDKVLQELALSGRLRSYNAPLYSNSDIWAGIAEVLASREGSVLEELTVVDYALFGTGSSTTPLQSVFANKLPSLRSLSLVWCYVDLEKVHAPRLRELTIETDSAVGGFIPHPPHFLLGALAVHANLTRLRIHVNTSFAPVSESSQQRVELARLVEVDLSCNFPTINTFFEHVSVPRIQKVKVNFRGPPLPNLSNIGSLIDCLTRLLPRLPVSATSGPCTLSFLRCNQLQLEGVFSPFFHELPFWTRDSGENDISFTFTLPEWFRHIPLLASIATSWVVWADRIECLELPDDPSVLSEYGPKLVLDYLTRVNTIICTPNWEARLVEGGLGGGRCRFVHPPPRGFHRPSPSPGLEQDFEEDPVFEIEVS